jgi:uncharacterized metal-binding protein
MADQCCTQGQNIMLLSCSGGSNVGQLSNRAAVELTQEGFGKMFCLAGIGGHISGLVQSAKDAQQIIVIDGCDIGCSKAILKNADVPFKNYVVLTELGIGKNKDFNLKQDDVDRVKAAIKRVAVEGGPDSGSTTTACGCSKC